MTLRIADPTIAEDWLRTITWDLPPRTWDEYVAWKDPEGVGRPILESLSAPSWYAAPPAIVDGLKAWLAAHNMPAMLPPFLRDDYPGPRPGLRASALGYDPDQPRDEHGRWGEGGGGDSTAADGWSISGMDVRAYPDGLVPAGGPTEWQATLEERMSAGRVDIVGDVPTSNWGVDGAGAVAAMLETQDRYPGVWAMVDSVEVVSTDDLDGFSGYVDLNGDRGLTVSIAADGVQSDRDAYATTIHEFGHVAVYAAYGNFSARPSVGAAPTVRGLAHPSGYSETSVNEHAAELFTAGHLGMLADGTPEAAWYADTVAILDGKGLTASSSTATDATRIDETFDGGTVGEAWIAALDGMSTPAP